MNDELTTAERYLASAVYYLMETGQPEVAKLLVTCDLTIERDDRNYATVYLRGSPTFHKRYAEDYKWDEDEDGQSIQFDGEFRTTLKSVFSGVLGETWFSMNVGVSLIEIDLDWRTRLIAEFETQKQINNQNPYEKKPVIWNGMRFSSPAEVEIAKALEKAGVVYLPNCLVRLGVSGSRETRFPDFMICHNTTKKWGILEVDGQTFHNGAAVQDYERMRKLTTHVAHFDRYEAKRCMSEPDKIVKEFLDILGSK